ASRVPRRVGGRDPPCADFQPLRVDVHPRRPRWLCGDHPRRRMSAAGPRAAEGSTIFTIRRSRPTADRSLLLGRLLLDRLLFEDIGDRAAVETRPPAVDALDRKSTRLNSSHVSISYAVFCL